MGRNLLGFLDGAAVVQVSSDASGRSVVEKPFLIYKVTFGIVKVFK